MKHCQSVSHSVQAVEGDVVVVVEADVEVVVVVVVEAGVEVDPI